MLAGIVIFLANQQAVDRLLSMTGLEKVLYPHGKNGHPEVVSMPDSVAALVSTETTPPSPVVAPIEVPRAQEVPIDVPDTSDTSEPPPAAAGSGLEPSEVSPPLKPNTYRLYFLKLSPEGRMEPAAFTRELPAGSTPLSATLKALLLGPTLQDKAQGALTMIPEGTKLLSLRIKDRIALVSLSPDFERNASGSEGVAGQLREIVWTATQFGSVDGVQFLIDGQYRDSLADGEISLLTPLTRQTVP